jgi:flavin-dependent dehydrogenase
VIASPKTYDFDFAVVGGGLAGSSAAISLAKRGHSVILFERETFPRFHIGDEIVRVASPKDVDLIASRGFGSRSARNRHPEAQAKDLA